MQETKDDTMKWRDLPCSCNGIINTVKMAMLPKANHRFNGFFTDLSHQGSPDLTYPRNFSQNWNI